MNIVDDLRTKLAKSFILGTDMDGYEHHYWRPADTVVVFDETGVHHREYLDGRVLEDWLHFVDERRGWALLGPHAQTGIAYDTQRKQKRG